MPTNETPQVLAHDGELGQPVPVGVGPGGVDDRPDLRDLPAHRVAGRTVDHDHVAEAFDVLTVRDALDDANNGATPLGLDPDALIFDLDPLLVQQGSSHF